MLEELKQAVLEGDSEKAVQLTERALSESVDAGKILNEALVAAMDIVGKEYERGDRYVPDQTLTIAFRRMPLGRVIEGHQGNTWHHGPREDPIPQETFSTRLGGAIPSARNAGIASAGISSRNLPLKLPSHPIPFSFSRKCCLMMNAKTHTITWPRTLDSLQW